MFLWRREDIGGLGFFFGGGVSVELGQVLGEISGDDGGGGILAFLTLGPPLAEFSRVIEYRHSVVCIQI